MLCAKALMFLKGVDYNSETETIKFVHHRHPPPERNARASALWLCLNCFSLSTARSMP
jgi:hypothetical protein